MNQGTASEDDELHQYGCHVISVDDAFDPTEYAVYKDVLVDLVCLDGIISDVKVFPLLRCDYIRALVDGLDDDNDDDDDDLNDLTTCDGKNISLSVMSIRVRDMNAAIHYCATVQFDKIGTRISCNILTSQWKAHIPEVFVDFFDTIVPGTKATEDDKRLVQSQERERMKLVALCAMLRDITEAEHEYVAKDVNRLVDRVFDLELDRVHRSHVGYANLRRRKKETKKMLADLMEKSVDVLSKAEHIILDCIVDATNTFHRLTNEITFQERRLARKRAELSGLNADGTVYRGPYVEQTVNYDGWSRAHHVARYKDGRDPYDVSLTFAQRESRERDVKVIGHVLVHLRKRSKECISFRNVMIDCLEKGLTDEVADLIRGVKDVEGLRLEFRELYPHLVSKIYPVPFSTVIDSPSTLQVYAHNEPDILLQPFHRHSANDLIAALTNKRTNKRYIQLVVRMMDDIESIRLQMSDCMDDIRREQERTIKIRDEAAEHVKSSFPHVNAKGQNSNNIICLKRLYATDLDKLLMILGCKRFNEVGSGSLSFGEALSRRRKRYVFYRTKTFVQALRSLVKHGILNRKVLSTDGKTLAASQQYLIDHEYVSPSSSKVFVDLNHHRSIVESLFAEMSEVLCGHVDLGSVGFASLEHQARMCSTTIASTLGIPSMASVGAMVVASMTYDVDPRITDVGEFYQELSEEEDEKRRGFCKWRSHQRTKLGYKEEMFLPYKKDDEVFSDTDDEDD